MGLFDIFRTKPAIVVIEYDQANPRNEEVANKLWDRLEGRITQSPYLTTSTRLTVGQDGMDMVYFDEYFNEHYFRTKNVTALIDPYLQSFWFMNTGRLPENDKACKMIISLRSSRTPLDDAANMNQRSNRGR